MYVSKSLTPTNGLNILNIIVDILRRDNENKSIIKEKISRKVIDVITNIEYNSIKEAAKALNIERRTLNDYLLGKRKNKTNLKYK